MTVPLPANGSTAWYTWATQVHDATTTGLAAKAAATHTHGVTDLTATGTRSSSTYLRGDNTWATPTGGGSTTYELNVKDYGAVGNGTTDDSDAFQATYAAAVAATAGSWSWPGEYVGRVKIVIPPGRYRITETESLIAAPGPAVTTYGLTFQGHGQGISEILFDPTTGTGSYLARNTRWRGLTFRDLSFLCDTTGASFISSEMTTGHAVQDYRMERCQWDGNWQYGFNLSGVDNNDSFTWDQCTVNGRWTGGFLYAGTSDQFLNFNIYDCKAEMMSGYFAVLPYGGSMNVIGGSFIFIDTAATGVFFTMPYQASHADGVQRFYMAGTRFELRALTHSIIDCHWVAGVVHFDSVDDAAHATILSGISTLATATFNAHGQSGPDVLWTNCNLVGQHSYTWSDSSFQYRPLVKYDSCVLRSWNEPTQVALTPGASGAFNSGGATPVEFVNCRGGAATNPWYYPQHATLNWSTVPGAVQRRAVSFKSPYSALPYTGEPTLDVWLPTGAMITGVRFHKKAGTGSSTSTSWSYTVATSEGTPTTLATIAGGGTTQWVNGFSSTVAVDNFVCDSDAKRHLTLTAANITQITNDSLAIVEYYG